MAVSGSLAKYIVAVPRITRCGTCLALKNVPGLDQELRTAFAGGTNATILVNAVRAVHKIELRNSRRLRDHLRYCPALQKGKSR